MIEEDALEVAIEEEIEKGIVETTIEMTVVGEMIEKMKGEIVKIEEEEDLSLISVLQANTLIKINNPVSLKDHHLRNRCRVFQIMEIDFQLTQIKSQDLVKCHLNRVVLFLNNMICHPGRFM